MSAANSMFGQRGPLMPIEFPYVWDYSVCRTVLITMPIKTAKHILEHQNKNNRDKKPYSIARYAADMRAGRWEVNGETIKFDYTGNLIDGQNRLTASIEAGVPLTTLAVFGLPPEAFHTIDRGKKRDNADDLQRMGETDCRSLSAVLKLLYHDLKGSVHTAFTASTAGSSFDELETLLAHPGIRQSNSFSKRKSSRTINAAPRLVAYCHYRFGCVDATKRDAFFESLITGVNLGATNPILRLRERLINDVNAKAKLPDVEVLALMIKAWNLHYTGTTIKKLVWRRNGDEPEEFPKIVGL